MRGHSSKGRTSFWALFVLISLTLAGCEKSPAKRLGIEYVPPTLPTGLERFFRPQPNQKAFEWLQDGKDSIDMHSYFRTFHKEGWEKAAEEFCQFGEFKLNARSDVHKYLDAMGIGMDAYWQGYQAARMQILEEKMRENGENPR